jgi:hypothetical protein
MKRCCRCKINKDESEFNPDKRASDNLCSECKVCKKLYNKEYVKTHKEQIKRKQSETHKKEPWLRILSSIKQRCENKNCKDYLDYGARGIKCLISKDELKEICVRDNYWNLKQPTINRKDNDGDYCLDNCEIIENAKNTAERNKRKLSIPIVQFDLQNNFIKSWESATVAAKELNINPSNIRHCLIGLTKTAYKFIWKYQK